jgi:hypothetical protein
MNDITILDLPTEILQMIFNESGLLSIYPLEFTCSLFHQVIGPQKVRNYITVVARNGNLKLLQWAYVQGAKMNLSELGPGVIIGGNLDMIKWLESENICYFGDWAWRPATVYGHLHILRWLRVTTKSCSVYVPEHAAEHGHLDILKWWKHDLHKTLYTNLCDIAVRGGHIHILDWLLTNGIIPQSKNYHDAFVKGHLHVCKWLFKQKVSIYGGYSEEIADCGHLHILQWLNKKLIILNMPGIWKAAAMNDHLHILKWLEYKGICYNDDKSICKIILWCGLDTIKWAYSQRTTDWPESACKAAIDAANLEKLKWLRSMGVPWNHNECLKLALRRSSEIVEWIERSDRN